MKRIANRKNVNGENDCSWLRGRWIGYGIDKAANLRYLTNGFMTLDYFPVNGNTWAPKYKGYAPGSLISFTI